MRGVRRGGERRGGEGEEEESRGGEAEQGWTRLHQFVAKLIQPDLPSLSAQRPEEQIHYKARELLHRFPAPLIYIDKMPANSGGICAGFYVYWSDSVIRLVLGGEGNQAEAKLCILM